MGESAFTVTLKAGGVDAPWLVIRGDSAEELSVNLDAAAAVMGDITGIDAVFKAANNAAPITASAAPANDAQNGSQAPATGTPAAEGALEVVTDKFGNAFTFNLPTAPRCAHGVMALKDGKKRDGGTYKIYVCPKPARDYRDKTDCKDVWPPR